MGACAGSSIVGPDTALSRPFGSGAERARGAQDPLGLERPRGIVRAAAPKMPEWVARDLEDCAETFPASARSVWHPFDGEFYYIDAAGRPGRAYAYLPPLAAAPRRSGCQAAVGRWGDEENPNDDYDGGHLIGSQLGGFGGRLNLVPQDLNFNRGNWAQIENKMAQCEHLPEASLFYYVRVAYADESVLIPEEITLIIENRDSRESVRLRFDNLSQGGLEGTVQRDRAVEFLDEQGCRS